MCSRTGHRNLSVIVGSHSVDRPAGPRRTGRVGYEPTDRLTSDLHRKEDAYVVLAPQAWLHVGRARDCRRMRQGFGERSCELAIGAQRRRADCVGIARQRR